MTKRKYTMNSAVHVQIELRKDAAKGGQFVCIQATLSARNIVQAALETMRYHFRSEDAWQTLLSEFIKELRRRSEVPLSFEETKWYHKPEFIITVSPTERPTIERGFDFIIPGVHIKCARPDSPEDASRGALQIESIHGKLVVPYASGWIGPKDLTDNLILRNPDVLVRRS